LKRNTFITTAILLGGLSAGAPAFAAEGDVEFSLRALGTLTRDLKAGVFNATEPRSSTFQLVSVGGRNLGKTGLFGEAGGYMAQELSQSTLAPLQRGDLTYGHLGWEDRGRHVRVQAGRLFVFTGAAGYAFLDGGSATLRLPGDVRLDAYGGTAAFQGFAEGFKAPIYGARAAWNPWEYGHFGLSFQSVSDVVDLAHRNVGLDFALRAMGPVKLTGAYVHDLLGGRTQEARVDAAYAVTKFLDVYLKGEVRDPLARLPKTSIFLAFVQRTDGAVGGGFDLRTPGALSVRGGYDRVLVGDGQSDGYRGFVDVRLRVDPAGRHVAGVELARLSNGDNGYGQCRLYGRVKPADRWTLSADVDGYVFAKEIRGEKTSLVGTLAARWEAKAGLLVGVDGQVWSNPYFTNQALGIVSVTLDEKLFYARGAAPAGVRGAK